METVINNRTIKSVHMSRKTSVMLGQHFEKFIETKISDGSFRNISEVVRAGLQLLEEEDKKQNNLRKAIQDGIESGVDNGFGPTIHLRELKKLKSLNE